MMTENLQALAFRICLGTLSQSFNVLHPGEKGKIPRNDESEY
jgi:hypothetical protein